MRGMVTIKINAIDLQKLQKAYAGVASKVVKKAIESAARSIVGRKRTHAAELIEAMHCEVPLRFNAGRAKRLGDRCIAALSRVKVSQ